MRDNDSNPRITFDPEEFASAPWLDTADEDDTEFADVHDRPTLVP